jgi:hypothetical protein
MAKEEKHSVKSGIIATVVGGLILSAIGYVFFFLPDLFRWVINFFSRIWNYFVSSTPIPRWLLWLLILMSVATLFRLVRPLLKRRNNEPKVTMYTEDSFEGVTWRWSYDWGNNPTDILPFCPYCDTMLVHSESSFWNENPKVSFYCERCKQVRAEIEGGRRSYAISMIARLIDRKIRSEEWRRLVSRNV